MGRSCDVIRCQLTCQTIEANWKITVIPKYIFSSFSRRKIALLLLRKGLYLVSPCVCMFSSQNLPSQSYRVKVAIFSFVPQTTGQVDTRTPHRPPVVEITCVAAMQSFRELVIELENYPLPLQITRHYSESSGVL